MPLTGREKATIFLSILGAENSARILRYLPDELADLIASGVNHLPTPSPEALSQVLNEFSSYLALPESGTPEYRPPSPPRMRRNYAALMYERPQMNAFLLSMLPEEQVNDVLLSLPRERALIEELMRGLRRNALMDKVQTSVKEAFAGKVF